LRKRRAGIFGRRFPNGGRRGSDAVAGFLFQPQWITVTNKKLKGVWKEVPQFENDFSAWSWE